MKLLITGICGFAGSSLALELQRLVEGVDIVGLDNLSRAGSEVNRASLQRQGIRFVHGDIRLRSDLEGLPAVDWVIDSAASTSVLAGVSGQTSSRQLLEHNLASTINLLEFCKARSSGLLLLSTSRVYSLARLSSLPMRTINRAYAPDYPASDEPGLSIRGIAEPFSTEAPVSLYGAAKLASESLAREYSYAFKVPVYINRCGVMAGAGQFGRPDQGIFSYWIHSYLRRRPLEYAGFGGTGFQVRDCLHPRDLATLVARQLRRPPTDTEPLNVSGGMENSVSLAQLSDWCATRFGVHQVQPGRSDRQYDVPWLVLDSSRAMQKWDWQPATRLQAILEEIASHAEAHPEWLELSSEA